MPFYGAVAWCFLDVVAGNSALNTTSPTPSPTTITTTFRSSALSDGSVTLEQATLDKVYADPDIVFIVFWAGGTLCFIITLALSMLSMREHYNAAAKAGFQVRRSLGPRGDLVWQLMYLPPVYSSSALLQLFVPALVNVMSFVRTCFFAASCMKIVRLSYLLGGGQAYLTSDLPDRPVRALAAPPCCCLICPVNVKKVYGPAGWSMSIPRMFIVGMKQFCLVAPSLGLIDITIRARWPTNDALLPITIVFSISSAAAMYSYRAFTGLVSPIVKDLNSTFNPSLMAVYVQLHLAVCKIVDLVINLVLKDGYETDLWVLPREQWAAMCSAMCLCVLEVLLTLLGRKAFPPTLYPSAPDHGGGLPLDITAFMEMNGIDVSKWEKLKSFHRDEVPRDRVLSDTMEMEVQHPAAATIGSSDGKNQLGA